MFSWGIEKVQAHKMGQWQENFFVLFKVNNKAQKTIFRYSSLTSTLKNVQISVLDKELFYYKRSLKPDIF